MRFCGRGMEPAGLIKQHERLSVCLNFLFFSVYSVYSVVTRFNLKPQEARRSTERAARLFGVALSLGLVLISSPVFCQNQFEDRPISDVQITFEGADKNISANE